MLPRSDTGASRRDRQVVTLERLLALDAIELHPTLLQASQALIDVLEADKVDIFLYDPTIDSLVALGTSDTPMGQREHALGLDRLPLTNGGRAVEVFQTGDAHLSSQVDRDPVELRGVKEGLRARSSLTVPLDVAGERRGILSVLSEAPEAFIDQDLEFCLAVARWVGLVMHRAELVEEVARRAVERGRREALAELVGRLTPREQEVAALVALGLSNAEIARRLVITEGTAANHIRSILQKLDVPSRARIAAIMAQLDLEIPSSHRTGNL